MLPYANVGMGCWDIGRIALRAVRNPVRSLDIAPKAFTLSGFQTMHIRV